MVDMSISLPCDKHFEIQQLALSMLQTQPVTVHHVKSFLGKTSFCAKGHVQLCQFSHAIQSDMLTVYHSPIHLHCSFHFSL